VKFTEQHVINRDDPRFSVIDAAAFTSKNVYNASLYEVRQAYIKTGTYLNDNEMDRRMQPHEAYKALPAKGAQQVLKQLHEAWTSFFEAREADEADPSKFKGRPTLPKDKHKTEGRNLLVSTIQAVRGGQQGKGKKKGGQGQEKKDEGQKKAKKKGALQQGMITPSMLAIEGKTRQDPQSMDQVRIVPRNGYDVVEVIHTKEPVQAEGDPAFCVGIDLGVTNLAARASNRKGWVPRLVNGRPIKAWNQWDNKRMKERTLKLPKEDRERVTKHMERITNTRNRHVNHSLHTASKRIVDVLVKEDIGSVVIGKNIYWKQEVNNGRHNNQNFVSIPHARFIEMIEYKAALVGIRVEVTEESYTSKASFVDLDPIPTSHQGDETVHVFSGKRIGKRNRLYRAKDGRITCADSNGAYNILRKRQPDAFSEAEGSAGYVVHPSRLFV